MRGFVALELGRKVGFDHGPGMGAILRIGKLDANSCLAVTRGAMGGDPDHFSGNGQTLLKFHHGKQQKYFITQTEALGAGYEQASTGNERHIRFVQRLPVFDGKLENSLLCHGSFLGPDPGPLYQPILQKKVLTYRRGHQPAVFVSF